MRCKCCNTPLKPEEIIWKPDIQEHESFCTVCLLKQAAEDFDSPIVWDESEHEGT